MQVTTYIHAVKIPFHIPLGPGISVERFVYSYLLYGKDTGYLIDAGKEER